ncbi:Pycsar system effector family protein [Streptomyces sp. NPDC086549]|uniref:Pycsar system effector family protein n=1 Tax=Streptomyces sp. NPDC086549 TaxID=3365752 RepID=UPI003816851E
MERTTPAPGPTPVPRPEAVADAWRIHEALVDWTGKVDTKAAFASSLQTAGLAVAVALASDGVGGNSGRLPSWPLWCAAALLGIAVLLSMWVVLPRMRVSGGDRNGPADFVYFGHLRHWDPDRLAEVLRTADPLPVLSRQMVVMAQVAWRKYRLVQLSFGVSAVAVVMLVAALAGR